MGVDNIIMKTKTSNQTVIDLPRVELANILIIIEAYLDNPNRYSRHDTKLELLRLMQKMSPPMRNPK